MADDFDPYYTWLGIPPKDQPPTHYRLLGVELFESNPDVIENAADRQMAHVRLFQNGPQGDISQKLLNEITSAKLCLLAPAKKAEYDQQLRAAQQAAEEAARPQTRAVRSPAKSRTADPADPAMPFDETLDIVSVTREPAVSPAFIAAAAETSSLPRRDRGKQFLLIGAGLVAALCVGAMLFFALRGGGQTQAANNKGSATAIVDPSTAGPGKKSPGDDSFRPPIGKTPPNEAKKTPPVETKTPVEPLSTPKPPPSDVAPQPAGNQSGLALRFVDRNYADLAGTAETIGAPEPPLTVEMWVRVNPTRSRTYLMGNIAVPGLHPSVPSGAASGWALSHTHNARFGEGPEHSGLLLQVGGKLHLAVRAEMDDAWHHVALCREPGQSDMAYRVYLDGKPVLKAGVPAESQRASPANLAIGCPPYQPMNNIVQTDMACNALRVSSAARYHEAFTRPRSFENDAQTLALLDFASEQSGELADRSGKGHVARFVGAHWVGTAGLLPAAGPVTNFLTKINFERDTTGGKWSLAGPTGPPPDRLDMLTPGGGAILRLADQVPPEYDLELTARRREGTGDLTIGLVCGGRRVALTCDADHGKNTLLQTINTGTPTHDGRLLEVDQPIALLIQVRTGHIVVLANGKSLLDWRGDVANLEMLPGLVSLPIGKGLFLSAQDGSFRIDKLEQREALSGSVPPPSVTYLDDLTEDDASIGWGKLGKHGDRGYDQGGQKVALRGRHYAHALSMHPPRSGKSSVTYRLSRQYREFRATAALVETTGWEKSASPLLFRVLGDDKVLWQSGPIQLHNTGQDCLVNVANVAVLKLEVECDGVNHGAHAAWLNPLLSRSPTKTTPKPKGSKEPPAVVKSAPPGDEALTKLVESVRQTFADDYAKAKTADDRLKLAEKLFHQSSQPGFDAGTRYALLYESRQLAADSGGLAPAIAAIEELAAKFEVLPGALWRSLWSDALARAGKAAKTNEARREVALACVEQAPAAFRVEQYEAAEAMLTQAANLMAQRDNQLSRRARDLAKQATQAKDRLAQANTAKEGLVAAPDDPKARLTLGKYLAFFRDDWTSGIEHLAKAGDDAVAKVAQRDQAAPADAKDQEALAEAWATWSKTAPVGLDREGAWCRAVYWYLKVMPTADGLAKTRLSQRIEDLVTKMAAAESLVSRTPWLDGDASDPRRWLAHAQKITSIAVSHDNTLVATASFRDPHKLWHLASGRLIREFPTDNTGNLALSPDGRVLANGSRGKVALWDTETGKAARTLDYVGGSLLSLKFSDDGQVLAVGGRSGTRDGFAQVWEIKTSRVLRRIDTTGEFVTAVALSADRRLVAVATSGEGDNHPIRVVEVNTGKELASFSDRLRRPYEIAFARDGRTATVVGIDGTFVWNVADGKLAQEINRAYFHSLTFSADGRRMLIGGPGGIELRQTGGQLLQKFPKPATNEIKTALTPNGKAALVGNSEGELQIWRLAE